MQVITGIFASFEQARKTAEEIKAEGFTDEQLNLLTPGAAEAKLDEVPATHGEQPGMGKAIGGVVGAATGTAAGAPLGLSLASAVVPGVGPAVALGLAAAALLGVGGTIGGAALGGSLENALTEGLPKDEIFVYEDALKQGRTAMFVMAENSERADRAREIFERNGAENVDAAREQWWVGLRDAEKEHYTRAGRDFSQDEKEYRFGFESALHLETRGKSYDEVASYLRTRYPELYRKDVFRRGYERGQRHYHGLANSAGGSMAGGRGT